jgi:prepilin-type N-terminal cleavage/methylation domain-containing protein
MASGKARGFSMIEMAVVLGIGVVMSCVALLSLQPALTDARTNQAYDTVLMQMRNARGRAIENRQQFIVCFGIAPPAGAATPLGAPTAQSIQVFQWPSGSALSSAVQVSTIDLPFDMQFQALSGIPTGNTPDGFGAGNLALNFDIGVAGGIQNQLMFMPDGSARDTLGNINNGVLYLARSGDIYSSRAISVFGASGRIRGWRLVNKAGVDTWIQQ